MQRHVFLDRLRVAATCAVVLLHTVTGVMDTTDMTRYPQERLLFLIILDLITWCVPLFVMISGYLFLNPTKEISFRKMFTKYCRRILFALFLFGVPYACMELVITERAFRWGMIKDAFIMVCKGQAWSHMWYLYMVLVLYLLTPAIKWILNRIPRTAFYGIIVLLLVESSILPFLKKLFAWDSLVVLPDGGIYLFYYLCGYLFVRANKKHSEIQKEVAVLSLVVLFCGMVCSRLFGDYSVQMAYNYPFTVATSLLMMWIAWKSEEKLQTKDTTLWKSVGGLCFTIYLIHPVFLNVLYKFLRITLLDFSIWLSLPGIFLTVLILSVIMAWILYKIPVLRKYVL